MPDVCHNCGSEYEVREASIERPYNYTESGLPNIRLVGISVFSCATCAVESADIPDMNGLHNLIAKDIILTPLPMTGYELRFLRKETRIRLKEFAEQLGVDPKTINNWETSEKLNKQTDVTVRMLVATELWDGFELHKTLRQLRELAKYSWEESEEAEPETGMDVEYDHSEWKLAEAA
jgi:DNA-binding transcriptional regulator YiaG